MSDYEPQFGYAPNPAATEQFVGSLDKPVFAEAAPHLLAGEKRDTFLWLPLLQVFPGWVRGRQAIGDCVSWGHELCCTMLMAQQVLESQGAEEWQGPAATEPIYGGSRVEARGGGAGGWSDGSYGGAAVKFLKEWGVLPRRDYSAETGNPEHDLREYSGRKAKQWGNYGCGGERDRQERKLDKLARVHPVQDCTLVTNFEEAAAAIQNGYPVSVCSGVGYGGMNRNSDGFVRRSGSWSHCMMFGGVRWDKPGLRLFQSWGHSASGPDPDVGGVKVPDVVGWCSWWVTPEDANAQLAGRDSFALSHLKGFPARELDFLKTAETWKWS